MGDTGNIPPLLQLDVYGPTIKHVRTDLISDWMAGRVSLCPDEMDLTLWGEIVDEVGRALDTTCEVSLNYETGMGYARANRGFPLEIIAYSPHALEWTKTQPGWAAEQSSWNTLFRGDIRGIT